MNIKIENYNGIESLDYDLEEGKVNFLFGISGAGKSSIASALVDIDLDSHVTVGKTINDLNVKVDGNDVDYKKFKIFNLDYMNDILINKNKDSDIYTILFGDGGQIANCKINYEIAISDLLSIKNDIVNAINYISVLVKELKLSTISKNTQFGAKSLNIVMEKNAAKVPSYRNALKYNSSQIKWMKDGTDMPSYANGVCPFCSRKMTQNRINKIDKLIIFDSKSYEKINAQNGIFTSLGLRAPDWKKKREVNEFNKKLLKYYVVKSELEKFNSYIDIASSMEIQNINIVVEKPSKQLNELYPYISSAVTTFNSKILSVKQALGKLKAETQKVINKNSEIINKKMDLLGIPYKFIKQNIDEKNKKAGYNICHILDTNKDTDRVRNLSFGEKNLIGLLLFLLANENHPGLIIDDPASSFDEYRRKVIFDMIYDLHKNSTMLVLSHDPVFAKYAVFHRFDSSELVRQKKPISELKLKFLNDTGKIDFMESYADSIIKDIKFEDFGNLSDFVLNRLSSLPKEINYQTAINLRFFFELRKKKKPLVYRYLSAIIHKVDYANIQTKITNRKISESDLVNIINNETGFTYSLLANDYLSKINSFTYLDFEKIVKCRELLNSRSKKDKVLKDELSNIIHMNSAQAICLNPYSFNYFSKYVKNYIDNN